MGTKELAAAVAEAAASHEALLLENHGALAVGRDVLSAFDRLECLEQCARLTILSKIVDTVEIKEEDRAELALMRK